MRPLCHIQIRAQAFLHRSRFAQIALILLVWQLGDAIARLTGLPVPGSIVALVLLLALLASGWMNLESLKRGTDWFLAEMLLFFVPAVVAVINHHELFGLLGVKILAVILCSTIAVMSVTAMTVELCYRWRVRREPAAAPLA